MSSMKWLAETSSVASILMCTGLTKLHPSTLILHKPSFHVICHFPFHVILHYWGIISKSETLRGSMFISSTPMCSYISLVYRELRLHTPKPCNIIPEPRTVKKELGFGAWGLRSMVYVLGNRV